MSEYINEGTPTTIWNGLTMGYFLHMCGSKFATEEQKNDMSYVASMMAAAEPIELTKFNLAAKAIFEIEVSLCNEWEELHGEPLTNRFGKYLGGQHPAIRPDLYEEALKNISNKSNA